jgi:hypothetical protein
MTETERHVIKERMAMPEIRGVRKTDGGYLPLSFSLLQESWEKIMNHEPI